MERQHGSDTGFRRNVIVKDLKRKIAALLAVLMLTAPLQTVFAVGEDSGEEIVPPQSSEAVCPDGEEDSAPNGDPSPNAALPALYPEPLYGDLNGNGILDSNDAALLRTAYLTPDTADGEALSLCDFNGNGYPDSNDYIVLRRALLQMTPSPISVSAGLLYELNAAGTGYVVVGMGTCTADRLSIPASYRGLPVTEIGESAFLNCASLTSVRIPESVTAVSGGAFIGCTGLRAVYYAGTGDAWCNIYFADDTSNPVTRAGVLYCSGTLLTELTVADGRQMIRDYAFSGNLCLQSVHFPDSLVHIGADAFSGCANLTLIHFGTGQTSISANVFRGCSGISSLIFPAVSFIGGGAFADCTGLQTVYYLGTAAQWNAMSVGESNEILTGASRSYYSQEKPTQTGDSYWYYGADGSPVLWVIEDDFEDVKVAVGLMYADGVTVDFDVRATGGFTLGQIWLTGSEKRNYSVLWELYESYITAVPEANLKPGYDYATDGNVAVGAYNVQTLCASRREVEWVIPRWNAVLAAYGKYAIASYINGSFAVRAGACADAASAQAVMDVLTQAGYSGLTLTQPSSTAVSVVNPENNQVLFTYDGGTDSTLGMTARQNGPSEYFLRTPANNTYRGVFQFTRYGNGVALTNVLPLEDYILGVVTWEISASWPDEALKTFSVAARTLAYAGIQHSKHATFDVCCTTCCQVYRGMNRVTQRVTDAGTATRGQILTYASNGRHYIATAAYSSSMGGVTGSAAAAWSSAGAFYLTPVCTPWERYQSVSRGTWNIEYTPAELGNRLRQYYPALTGDIRSVDIVSYAPDSTYVREVSVTDVNGNSVIIIGGDRIRTRLGLYSANFVAGYAGNSVYRYDYVLRDQKAQEFFTGTAYPLAEVNAALAEAGLPLMEADTRDQPYSANNLPDIVSIATRSVRLRRTETLSGTAGNIVFSGRGWGHGVGMSAYGVLHLCDYNYSYRDILSVYYQGISIRTIASYRAGN